MWKVVRGARGLGRLRGLHRLARAATPPQDREHEAARIEDPGPADRADAEMLGSSAGLVRSVTTLHEPALIPTIAVDEGFRSNIVDEKSGEWLEVEEVVDSEGVDIELKQMKSLRPRKISRKLRQKR